MPKTTETANLPQCADLCGMAVNSPKSIFLQGHDQRLVSVLARKVAGLEHLPAEYVELLGLESYDESGDIQARINEVSAAVGRRFSPALAAKADAAMMRFWALGEKRAAAAAAKAERQNAPKPERKPRAAKTEAPAPADDAPASTVGTVKRAAGVTMGSPVKAKIGRWVKDAFVHGMNQKGSVTAVSYTDKNGNDKVATEGKFTLVVE